ncbi:ABC transporter ATP-binding protein [Amycolatopsis sp. NPDC023774]|uniref:ABC transporter ATP-binding protein n=1 Tax=Amycolatopsis sp. NPDC023774 TaxID=3155015 RepID=UPI0033E07E10
MSDAVLEVRDLRIEFGARTAVDGVDFAVRPGEVLGIIGESGSGKSSVALAALRMLPATGRVTGGAVLLRGTDIAALSENELRDLRGGEIGLVFQDPMSSLNPMLSIGRHLDEALRAHGKGSAAERRTRATELLELVGIPDPERRLRERPHRLSGGQRQRVMIALALAAEPAVLFADEPTTALDATTAVGVLALLKRVARELDTAVVLITHDIGVVAATCERVVVMRTGRVVEHGAVEDVLLRPQHPYTQGLLAAVPRLDTPLPKLSGMDRSTEPLLEVSGLSKTYRGRHGQRFTVLDDVSLSVRPGETLGIVGESGSGKSTLARAVAGAHAATAGALRFRGEELTTKRSAELRRAIQLVFQDPYASLHPRMRIGTALEEPLRAHGLRDRRARADRVVELLREVGLDPEVSRRRPAEFSGGQRQRIGIARALATEPDLLICDEPVSSLDVSVQARILDLLVELRERLGLTMLFISHDLAVVRQVSHRIAVLYSGSLMELGPAGALTARPLHPYTVTLLSAAPSPDPSADRRPEELLLRGEANGQPARGTGCPFANRCPIGPVVRDDRGICRDRRPELSEHEPGRFAACHFAGSLTRPMIEESA